MKNLKKQEKQTFILFLLSFVSLNSGCATSPAPEGYVAKQWATAFRELQITPIFPPREDVQVGDIYVVPVAPEDEDAVFEAKGYLPRGMCPPAPGSALPAGPPASGHRARGRASRIGSAPW